MNDLSHIPWASIPGGQAISEGRSLTEQQHRTMQLGLHMIAYYQVLDTEKVFRGEALTGLVLKGMVAVDKAFDDALKAKKKEGSE